MTGAAADIVQIRPATIVDVDELCALAAVSYPDGSTNRRYQKASIARDVMSSQTLVFVAEHRRTREIIGSASLAFDVGDSVLFTPRPADSEPVGDFGRLMVHPEHRRRGIGKLLMAHRLSQADGQVKLGLVVARVAEMSVLSIAFAHGFAVVGFFPPSLAGDQSFALLARYFVFDPDDELEAPVLAEELVPLACRALENCRRPTDVIRIDDASTSYQVCGQDVLVTEPSDDSPEAPPKSPRPLNRVAEGELRQFQARTGDSVLGTISFVSDAVMRIVRVWHLAPVDSDVTRTLVAFCSRTFEDYRILIDVGASNIRLQRTLLELGFRGVAYIPALGFQSNRRYDVIKMMRMSTSCLPDLQHSFAAVREFAAVVCSPSNRGR